MEKRTLKHYLIIYLKGMAMGAADVVPGVSGGTIAFISGIYEELLASISSVKVGLLKTLFNNGFKVAWKEVNGYFLLTLLAGIFTSILSLARLISWLLEHKPVLVWSFFFGLVLASIFFVARQISRWTIITVFMFVLGALLAYYITTLQPLISENTSSLFMFFAGALAICAMILPGISGAFILVLLGAYKPILDAIYNKNIALLVIVAVGAVTGLLSFSKLLNWLFDHYKNFTLAALTGFILGSLNKVWPWKEVLTWRMNSKGLPVPFTERSISPLNYAHDPQLFFAIVLAVFGFVLIVFLEKLADTPIKK